MTRKRKLIVVTLAVALVAAAVLAWVLYPSNGYLTVPKVTQTQVREWFKLYNVPSIRARLWFSDDHKIMVHVSSRAGGPKTIPTKLQLMAAKAFFCLRKIKLRISRELWMKKGSNRIYAKRDGSLIYVFIYLNKPLNLMAVKVKRRRISQPKKKRMDITVTYRYKRGTSDLHDAIENNKYKTAAAFVKDGADVNIRDVNGCTPLHWAVRGEDTRAPVILLLKNGAKVNVKDDQGNTPLHYAAMFGESDTVMMLLERGAEATVRNKYGHTPLETARIYKNTVVIWVLENCYKSHWPISSSTETGR